jgi:hypothetical protein
MSLVPLCMNHCKLEDRRDRHNGYSGKDGGDVWVGHGDGSKVRMQANQVLWRRQIVLQRHQVPEVEGKQGQLEPKQLV